MKKKSAPQRIKVGGRIYERVTAQVSDKGRFLQLLEQAQDRLEQAHKMLLDPRESKKLDSALASARSEVDKALALAESPQEDEGI